MSAHNDLNLCRLASGICTSFFCSVCLLLNWFRFWKVFPKEWRKPWRQQICWRWEKMCHYWKHRLYTLSSQFCWGVWFVLCYYLDENTKEQESPGREGQYTNDDGDKGRRGGKKEESHWWTRFQVRITVFSSRC